MRFWLSGIGALCLASIMATNANAQIDYNAIQIVTDKIGPNLYILSGSAGADQNHQDAAGGRIGVLAGPDGVLMVDSQYGQISDKVLAAVHHISTAPIKILVNTHIHIDHTGGNAFFAKQGAMIYAREELREEMLHPPAPGQPRDPAGLPKVTYGLGAPLTINMDGETVDFIPVRAAHTGGDTIVRFRNANVIMIGDFYRNFGYPFIDIANGGSLPGMLDAVDMVMKLAGPDTKLVPGHGTIISRNDLVPYRDMVMGVSDRVRQMVRSGASLQQVIAAKPTMPFDAKVAGGLLPAGAAGTSADRFVTELYQQVKDVK
jgi:cyclase